MAHKYSDFDSAFNDLKAGYPAAKLALERALSNAQAAYAGASDPVDKTHFGFATYAIEQLVLAVRQLGDYIESAWDRSHLYESIYWANKDVPSPPEYELSMLKILAAMAIASPDELETFIALVDAYRAAMWNRPFREEYFATYVRFFKQWP